MTDHDAEDHGEAWKSATLLLEVSSLYVSWEK